MMSKLSTPESKPSRVARLLRASLAGLALLGAGAALMTGCLDRPVVPAAPSTSNVVVLQIAQSAVDKIDLLFMIDNSTSMADKQNILAAAVPQMVSRLVSPICVDANDVPVGNGLAVDANGNCSMGAPEFSPIKDIHIAIVTSSLGSHGGDVCNTATNADDHGQALGSVRPGLEQWTGGNNVASGFLAWDPLSIANPPTPKDNPPGDETDATKLGTDFANQVKAAGEVGCGYEASLEAWYRFLIDTEPPNTVDVMNGASTKEGINGTLLMQRSLFLRPDSLVAIIALSDENDCSITDAGFGWFLASRTLNGGDNRMYRATHFCDMNPNDPCCMSCGDTSVPPPQCNIGAVTQDPSCQMDSGYLTAATDSVALRCWDTKRRFGFDLLYPTVRYSNALQQDTICKDSEGRLDNYVGPGGCNPVVNPLFDPTISVAAGGKVGTSKRDHGLVFFSAIIGVPWQDLANDMTRDQPNQLTYLTEQEMESAGRWGTILGDPTPPGNAAPVLPSDPFMVETDIDRTTLSIAQANPVEPTAMLVPHTSQNPQANVINGHEQNVVNADDLQYACIFPLTPPKTCMPTEQACDCSPGPNNDLTPVTNYNSPLCNPPGGGAPTATQNYAKGYPGLRFLKVLHDFGKNAIPASICPKVTDNAQADYGYNPAVAAIINRLKDALHGACLPRPLAVDPTTGAVPCRVVEAQFNNGQACNPCLPANGRKDVTGDPILAAVVAQMQGAEQCDNTGGHACTEFCFCEITAETGTAEDSCRADPIAAGAIAGMVPGYCYISNDDSKAMKGCPNGNADCTTGTCTGGVCQPSAALTKCPTNQQQLLGFVSTPNEPTPANGAIGFVACLGAATSGG